MSSLKCFQCNKSCSVLSFKCRCENIYCLKHKTPENHQCNFDYKQYGKDILQEQNPIIVGSKINKI